MDSEQLMFILVQFAHMTWGAALFFSVLALCAMSLTYWLLDHMACAVRRVSRFISDMAFLVGDFLFAKDEPDFDDGGPYNEPKRAVMPKAKHPKRD